MIERPSIQRKVTFALFAAIGTALAMAVTTLWIHEYQATKARAQTTLESLAETLAPTLVASLDFNTPEVASESLQRLEPSGLVLGAQLFRVEGDLPPRLYAKYERRGANLHFGPLQETAPYTYQADRSLLIYDIRSEGHEVAKLQIEADTRSFQRGFRNSVLVLLTVTAVLGVSSLWLSRYLQQVLTRPILRLSVTAERVRVTGDYSQRAQVDSVDEIGRLAANFNRMLAGIAERDQRLAEQAAMQQLVLENAGAAIISTDTSGLIRGFNATAERLLGYARDEVLGVLSPLAFHEQEEIGRLALQLSLAKGRTVRPDFALFVELVHIGHANMETMYVRKDGTRVPVQLVVSPLVTADGRLLGYCGIATDQTEKKAAEKAVRSSEERMRRTLEVSPIGFSLTDREGNTLYLNRKFTEWFGYTKEQLPNFEAWWTLAYPDPKQRASYRRQWMERLSKVETLKGEARPMEAPVTCRDGSVKLIEFRAQPFDDLLLVALMDVTERKVAEVEIRRLNEELELRVIQRTAELDKRVEQVETLNREQAALMADLRASQQAAAEAARRVQEANEGLLRANEELESFSYSVSHDLRAPLRNISGFIELMQRKADASLAPEFQRHLGIIRAESLRMGGLIDDLLTFSRLGRADMRTEAVQMQDLVEQTKSELARDLEGREIEWLLGTMPLVKGDRILLRQVVANLISNAVKFTRQRTPARIEFGVLETQGAPGLATFYCRDNGAGFDPKYTDKLFKVFQRLHTQKQFDGTGIGLANVKRIVTRHGGQVWAEGAVDKGACIYFTLPLE